MIWNNSQVAEFCLPGARSRLDRTQIVTGKRRQKTGEKCFVLEIGGRAVLAFSARSVEKAGKLCAQDWFVEELASYRSGGQPIWDGNAEFRIRCANAAETAELRIAKATERARREYEGYVFVFFVPVDPNLLVS